MKLVELSGWAKFPPRLPEQPIFYPVMNIEYAIQIASQWNVPTYGCGFVLEFDVDSTYLGRFNVENVGGEIHNELWVPSDELEEFNNHIVGKIRLVASLVK